MPYLGREPGVSNNVTGNLKVSGTISAESINDKIALNGSDASSPQANINDHFIFEDGGTDGSETNAGDNLLLEDITPSQAEVSLSNIAAGGTSGQFLQSQGSLTTPTFATVPSSAGLNHLTTATASSSASLDFTSLITSTYDVYLIILDEIMPATNAADLYLLLSTDNGSSFTTADYAYVTDTLTKHNHGDSVSRSSTSARGLAQIQLMNSAATNQGQGVSGPIYLFSPLNASLQASLRWSFIGNDNGVNIKVLDGAGKQESTSTFDAFQIKFSSGNIASGTVRVYGIANG